MFDKLVRSMFYGSLKTKLFLWSVLVMGLVAFGLLVAAVALQMPQLGVGAALLGLFTFVTSQSVSVQTLERDKKSGKKKTSSEHGEDSRDPKERERAKARFLASLNEKQMKKILKEHKVTQTHVKIMIDSYEKRRLSQVPSFAWRTDDFLHFLVLEGHANEFEIPLNAIQGIYMEKNVTADAEKDYASFRYENYIAKMFSPLLPDYAERSVDGELVYQKDLFYIEPGVYITNKSMANLMQILPRVPFLVDDQVCRSDRFDEFFKEIYRYSILCKAGVFSLEEYKEKIHKTLDALLKAPISGREFVQSLRNMSQYRLITNEYVMEYTQKYRELKGM
ncbi:MAG: hypothetical protein J1E62_04185 [Lachnospiraceae bacterium]|nr:hypothetical protein [Lachnospiraceae bacterium]